MTDEQTIVRRAKVLEAARWCFLNFGFAKTTFNDIAQRADLSRTLLYRLFRNKNDIYRAVFVDWLISRTPAAREAAGSSASVSDRLHETCRVLAIEPWSEMVGTPMGADFLSICEQIDPDSETLYREVAHACIATILQDGDAAMVFLLSLNGLFSDQPPIETLEQRIKILIVHFALPLTHKDTDT